MLSNAVMYSPTGSTVEVSLSSDALEDDEDSTSEKTLLSVIVRDMGLGISQDDQKKLF